MCKWYQKMQESKRVFGLFWAFIRYFNCEFSANLRSHLDVLSLKKEKEMVLKKEGENAMVDIDAYELRMEDFQSNFSKMANLIVDLWNVKDTPENRELLRKNGHKFAKNAIGNERKLLLQMLDKYANPNAPKGPIHPEHMTSQLVNRTQEAIELLTFSRGVCEKIKEMTLQMDYPWSYPQFC